MRNRCGGHCRKMVLTHMLETKNISVSYGKRTVFSNLSVSINPGEIYCISGASGCGKTTLGRVLAGLRRPDSGQIMLDNENLELNKPWPVQYLYQSPLTAMNPRWHIEKIVSESGPVDVELARVLGIQSDWAERYPHELSGGQLQRISILRALGAKPRYLIADEITAALDPIAQAQIWHFFLILAKRLHLGIFAISHDEELLAKIGTEGLRLKLSR